MYKVFTCICGHTEKLHGPETIPSPPDCVPCYNDIDTCCRVEDCPCVMFEDQEDEPQQLKVDGEYVSVRQQGKWEKFQRGA